jgi:hypothetical protein
VREKLSLKWNEHKAITTYWGSGILSWGTRLRLHVPVALAVAPIGQEAEWVQSRSECCEEKKSPLLDLPPRKGKSKAIPVQAVEALRFLKLRLPHFQSFDSQMAARLSALRTGRFLPLGKFLVLIFVRGWVDPRAIVRLEGLGKLKIPPYPGLEPATFRIVT